ncbi:RidA family protein [Dactylosporangium sp. AC04546]|uniref:RidA family protein n=1 Tax=Dactylosporangium sp. AC04546 TaxID=2862460 RepID=UPI001EDD63A9|nr:RidA family protein [Dactylosporangium sp. AC04546]WVK81457.1 RidA family protein [Dactylosporangium sp. AC04546]
MTVHLPAVPYPDAERLLSEAGLSPGDVVHVTEYVTAASSPEARAAARKGYDAPVSTIPVAGLLTDAAELVELTAWPGGGTRAGELVVAGDLVYLPSVHTTEGGFREQYRACLDKLDELLAAAGLGLDALVRTTDYTATATRSEYPRCGRPRKDLLGTAGVFPGAAGILVDTPVEPGAHVALDALASSKPLRAVNPGWSRYDTLTYGPGVVAGDTLVMSGFGALDPATQLALHEGDLLRQAVYLYDSVDLVVQAAGGGTVTRILDYITPAAVPDYPALAALRAERYPDAVVTTVVCSALLRPEFLLETVPTAVLGR